MIREFHQRHLSGEKLKAVIQEFHQRHPDISNRKIAQAVGVSDHTVARSIKRAGAQDTHVPKVEGIDGKQYPSDPEQQRESIRNEIAEHPEKSDREIARDIGVDQAELSVQLSTPDIGQREIAKAVGVDHKTVGEALKDRPSGESPQLDRTIGGDGRERPATAEKAEQQRETIRETIIQHPEKSDRQIARELGIKPETVVRAGLSDIEKDEMAYTLNLSRRHLSHDQKIEIGKQMAERHPESYHRSEARGHSMDF